jgi:hypothetical protein
MPPLALASSLTLPKTYPYGLDSVTLKPISPSNAVFRRRVHFIEWLVGAKVATLLAL